METFRLLVIGITAALGLLAFGAGSLLWRSPAQSFPRTRPRGRKAA